jgi:hypothetical protein
MSVPAIFERLVQRYPDIRCRDGGERRGAPFETFRRDPRRRCSGRSGAVGRRFQSCQQSPTKIRQPPAHRSSVCRPTSRNFFWITTINYIDNLKQLRIESGTETMTGAPLMTSQIKSSAQLADVHLFCPECGEPATLKTVMPSMFSPDVNEITYVCDSCGAETRVQVKAR